MAEKYSNQNKGELEKLLGDKRKALRAGFFAAAGGKSANVKEGRELRRDIARILTALKNK